MKKKSFYKTPFLGIYTHHMTTKIYCHIPEDTSCDADIDGVSLCCRILLDYSDIWCSAFLHLYRFIKPDLFRDDQ